MKRLLLLALFAGGCFAQTLTLACTQPPAGAKTLGCTLTLASGAGISPASSWQATVTSTPALGAITATTAGTAATAIKITTVSGTSMIQSGIGSNTPPPAVNATPIADGLVANLSIAIPTGLTGNVTLTLAGGLLPPIAASASASGFALTPLPNAVSVSILPATNLCDLTGDGQVSQADVAAQQALIFSRSPKCGRTGPSCSVVDLQIVEIAALGGACGATQ